MATNALAPTGLVFSRNIISASPTFQANKYKIKAGYGSKIGIGDLVLTGTGGNQGYVTIAGNSSSINLGVFAGVLPYYDQTAQQTMYGLNGSYPTSANPLVDIDCLVIDDPFAVFRVQVSGGPWATSWRGQNIQILANTNGAPNISGVSTLALDATTIATTNTLPFRIQELVGVTGGPQDPANTNPWIEVRLNLAEQLQPLGI